MSEKREDGYDHGQARRNSRSDAGCARGSLFRNGLLYFLYIRSLVIDAGVRDIADLQKMGFPVWSKCISAQGTVKETLGDVNIPVVCGGQNIHPGDSIIADDDDVVVVAREEATDILNKSEQREQKEAGVRKRYAAGELGLDMNNVRLQLAAKGLKYPDRKS